MTIQLARSAFYAISLSAATLGASAAMGAGSLPAVPKDCARSIAVKGYCSGYETSGVTSGSVSVTIYAVVEKSLYSDVETVVSRYTDFDRWPLYVDLSGSGEVVFDSSYRLDDAKDADGSNIIRHYANYELNSPIGFQRVRVVSHYKEATPYEGAAYSLEFEAQTSGEQEVPVGEESLNGAVGVSSQTGSVHAIECAKSDLCGEDQLLVAYQSTIRPAIDLLPSLAAPAITAGSEAILIGMLLIDESIDGDVL